MDKRVLREAIKKILLEKMLETMNKFPFFFFKCFSRSFDQNIHSVYKEWTLGSGRISCKCVSMEKK